MNIPLNALSPKVPRYSVFNTCPDRLHHYTSVETLRLILANKTIRFNRLDNVNDPREALSNEYKTSQTLVFASCWTYGEESIPHWKMYSDFTGIRLTMPTLMFSGRNDNHKVTNDDSLYQIGFSDDRNHPIQIVRRGKTYIGNHPGGVYGPTKVRYVADHELMEQNFFPDRPIARYDLRQLGIKKSIIWAHEREIRFRIFASPSYSPEIDDFDWMSPQSFIDNPVITPYVDIPLDNTALSEAEVMLGPHISTEQRKAVEELCAQYAPNAKIVESRLQIRPAIKK